MENNILFASISPSGIMSVEKAIVSDSVLYEKMKFILPEDWENKSVTAVFKNGDKILSIILNEDDSLCTGENECYIPHEVIKAPQFTVSAFATFDKSIITSTAAVVKVLQSGYGEGDKPSEPTPTEYEQIINLVEETKNLAQSVRDDADNGKFKGDKGEKGDKGDTGAPGRDGIDGTNGTNGVDGQDGADGIGVSETKINQDGNLIITYTDGNTKDLGKVVGAKGDKGEKGERGEPAVTDQTYSPTSENAQSGKAVAEAVKEEEQRSNNVFANALKGSVSGSAVRMDDTEPVEHTIGVKVKSKNMLNPTLWSTAETSFGVTVQYLPDEDCFLLNGTATKTDGASVGIKKIPNIPLDKGKYTASATYVSGTVSPENQAVFYIGAKDDPTASTSVNWMATKLNMSNTSSTADSRNYLMQYWFYWYGDITFTDYKVKLQFEKNPLATSRTPYVPDLTATKVIKCKRNLFDKSLVWGDIKKGYDLQHGTFVGYSDNGWILQGNNGNDAGDGSYSNGWFTPGRIRDSKAVTIPKNTVVTISADITVLEFREVANPTNRYSFGIYINQNQTAKINIRNENVTKRYSVTYTLKQPSPAFPAFTLNSNKIKIENIQIELGTEATDYENFSGKVEYTPAEDGTVEGVKSLYPTTTLIPDTEGLILEADYNRDINKAFAELQQAIISLSGAEIQSAIEAQYPTEAEEVTEETETAAE